MLGNICHSYTHPSLHDIRKHGYLFFTCLQYLLMYIFTKFQKHFILVSPVQAVVHCTVWEFRQSTGNSKATDCNYSIFRLL